MENIGWGLQMTVLGMGLVFALLAMLWGLLNLVLKLDKEPEPVPAAQAQVEAERIAAEQTGRRVFLMELDGRYCDVIAKRWQEFTGGKAERIPGPEPKEASPTEVEAAVEAKV